MTDVTTQCFFVECYILLLDKEGTTHRCIEGPLESLPTGSIPTFIRDLNTDLDLPWD